MKVNKKVRISLILSMFILGSFFLGKVAQNYYKQTQQDAAVINLPGIGFWENEREDGGYFTIVDQKGKILDKTARVVYVGDRFIAEDNKEYRIDKIVKDRAIATLIAQDALAGFHNLSLPVDTKNNSNNLIAIYHTHSAESYVPTDGTDSIPGNGGIFKVGDTATATFEREGLAVEHSKRSHEPRDSQAYIRSRRTAVQLLKDRPAAIIDIHRDGVPDPDFYKGKISGNSLAKIRIVVGRQNQNMQANLDFAKQVKAGIDKIYPGLVKGIFMAKGNYNQDLSPRSMLIEVGTHTNDRYRAENGIKLFADALPQVLGLSTGTTTPNQTGYTKTPANKGDWSALWWVLGIALIGGAAFLFISTGSLKGAADKLRQFSSTEWANFLGSLPRKRNNEDKIRKEEDLNKK
ncbi:stage II sporulation protein P [Bacillota bacterium LX-D]|nr:stage II sporulation protein P [Bacillota bacterium LX-D]